MELTHLTRDTVPEEPIRNKVTVNSSKYNEIVNKSKIKVNYKRIAAKIKRRLEQVDKHHLQFAIDVINHDNLQESSVTKKLKMIPSLCVSCNSCIRSLNYCSVYKESCSTIVYKDKIKTCSFKSKMK